MTKKISLTGSDGLHCFSQARLTHTQLLENNAMNEQKKKKEKKNHGSHFSNGVVELSGADDHLHLEDVAFGDAALHQTLQHLLLVQSDTEKKKHRQENQL